MSVLHIPTAITVADNFLPAVPETDPCAMLANTLLQLGEYLGGPRMVVSVTAIKHASADLTTGELARYSRLGSPERRESWLAGRAAIKAARERLGLGTDTADLCFPNACTSLTHAAGFAIAVAAPRGTLRGLGVDLEARRKTSPGINRFFLTDSECNWLDCRATHFQADELIRLWTIKEAVYKACPDNHRMPLSRIELQNPAVACGEATGISGTMHRAAIENKVSYASKWTAAGCVSLALALIRARRRPSLTEFWMGKKQ